MQHGPIPLSKLQQHVQKYLLVLPILCGICQEISTKGLKGCQIVDYITTYKHGSPIVMEVIQRILLKVRSVFLKQCFTWMIYGDLEDPGDEFFIFKRVTTEHGTDERDSSIYGEVLHKLANNNVFDEASNSNNKELFDWNSSYILRLEYLPESHVSPRTASKIMFAGKAVKLLKSSNSSNHEQVSTHVKEVYDYLSSSSHKNTRANTAGQPTPVGDSDGVIHTTFGYSKDDLDRFMQLFNNILTQPEYAVEIFEALIDDINNTISAKLWSLLRDHHMFTDCLQAMRSTYLLGRGELYQCILDGILELTQATTDVSSRADTLLNWDVMRSAGKLLGLDDDILSSMLRLHLIANTTILNDFNACSNDIKLLGAAAIKGDREPSTDDSSKQVQKLVMCAIDGNSESSYFTKLWSIKLLKRAASITTTINTSPLSDVNAAAINTNQQEAKQVVKMDYSKGAMWFSDQKYVAKGFTFSTQFTVSNMFSSIEQCLTTHSVWEYVDIVHGTQSLVLGSLSFSLHNDKHSTNVIAVDTNGSSIPGAMTVGVEYIIRRVEGVHSYFIRIFVRSRSTLRGNFSTIHRDVAEDILVESLIPVKDASRLTLDIEYLREIRTIASESMTHQIAYTLRARVSPNSKEWDISIPMDLANYVKLTGGLVYMGLIGSGLVVQVDDTISSRSTAGTSETNVVSSKSIGVVTFVVESASLHGNGALTTYPVASPYTSTRYPDTFLRLNQELNKFRTWMNLKLVFVIPSIFKIIFDSDAIYGYERVFNTLMKIKLVAHALEKIWKVKSRLSEDRIYCRIRHSMHFFLSNLIYYLQVDVIDSEYDELYNKIDAAASFQHVLRAHRNFIANMIRLSMVDNLTIQEGIERILQVCLRFIAISKLLVQQEEFDGSVTNNHPVVIPPEEIDAINKEFISQITYLFSILRKVENRGFIFRLDFNSFFSSL